MGKKKYTAGIALYRRRRGAEPELLVVHPTGAKGWGTWSIPKGHGESGESLRDTAVRETVEEVNLAVPHRLLEGEPGRLWRKKRKQSLYYWLIDATEWGLPDELDFEQLQLEEIDEAKFVSLTDAGRLLTAKQIPMLRFIALAAQ